MAKNDMPNWNITCERYVAFLDIMGFKDFMFRNTHDTVYEILGSFVTKLNAIERVANKRLSIITDQADKKGIITLPVIRPVVFSDSIILITNDISIDTFITLTAAIEWVFANAITKKIPIKGAIALGEQTSDFNNSLHFGRPLIDAFELQDELLFYGVALHHTAEKYLKDNDMIDKLDNDAIIGYQTPMKSAIVSHYIVNWISSSTAKKETIDAIPFLYDVVSGSTRVYVDNTIDCANWCIKKRSEFVKSITSAIKKSQKAKKTKK